MNLTLTIVQFFLSMKSSSTRFLKITSSISATRIFSFPLIDQSKPLAISLSQLLSSLYSYYKNISLKERYYLVQEVFNHLLTEIFMRLYDCICRNVKIVKDDLALAMRHIDTVKVKDHSFEFCHVECRHLKEIKLQRVKFKFLTLSSTLSPSFKPKICIRSSITSISPLFSTILGKP